MFFPLNPSVTCHTFVMDGERKSVKGRKGEEAEKRAVRHTFGLPPSVTVTDEGSIKPLDVRHKIIRTCGFRKTSMHQTLVICHQYLSCFWHRELSCPAYFYYCELFFRGYRYFQTSSLKPFVNICFVSIKIHNWIKIHIHIFLLICTGHRYEKKLF